MTKRHRKVYAHFKPTDYGEAVYAGTVDFVKSHDYDFYATAHTIRKQGMSCCHENNPNHHNIAKGEPAEEEIGKFLDLTKGGQKVDKNIFDAYIEFYYKRKRGKQSASKLTDKDGKKKRQA